MVKKRRGRAKTDSVESPPIQDSGGARPVAALEESRARLGDMLVQEGVVTEGQLEEAMKHQEEHGGFIGNTLVALKHVDQNTLVSFLVKQCKIPHISLLDYGVNEELFKLVPIELCNKHLCVPIDRLGKILTVAMVDPFDAEALESVRVACPDLKIKPILCDFNHFDQVARKHLNSTDADDDKTQDVSAQSFGLSAKAPAKNEKKALKVEPASNVEAFPAAGSAKRRGDGNEDVLAASGVVPVGDDRVRRALLESPLYGMYSFETFFAGSANSGPESMARTFAQSQEAGLSPMFICGGTGLGKTHLLHAIGNAAAAADPDLRVRRLTAGMFARGFAGRGDGSHSFLESFANTDLLLLDDVHQFADLHDVQAALGEVIDVLCGADRLIVMAGLMPDGESRALDPQLISRLGGAAAAVLTPPEFDTRVEILRHLSSEMELGDEVLELIAEHVADDVRRLKGAFGKVAAYVRVAGGVVSADEARELIVQFDAGAVA